VDWGLVAVSTRNARRAVYVLLARRNQHTSGAVVSVLGPVPNGRAAGAAVLVDQPGQPVRDRLIGFAGGVLVDRAASLRFGPALIEAGSLRL
jgi:hypothetical protein